MNERPLIPLKTAMKASFTRVTLFGLEILAKEKKQWLEGRIVKELSFVTYLVSLYIYIYIYIMYYIYKYYTLPHILYIKYYIYIYIYIYKVLKIILQKISPAKSDYAVNSEFRFRISHW